MNLENIIEEPLEEEVFDININTEEPLEEEVFDTNINTEESEEVNVDGDNLEQVKTKTRKWMKSHLMPY